MNNRNKNIIIILIAILLVAISVYFLWEDRTGGLSLNEPRVEPQSTKNQETPAPNSNLLLPDLKAEPISEIYIQKDPRTQNREIRFNTMVANLGEGPLEMIGIVDESGGKTKAIQNIKTKESAIQERIAGYFAFHPDHKHWHFDDFTLLEIFLMNSDGSTGGLAATSSKQTFCLADEIRISPPLPDSPLNIVYDWECSNNKQGISIGWRDNYEANLAGQEIDIQNLPDGRYFLRSTADPLDRILEKDETNNSSQILVEISRLKIEIIK